MTTIALIADCAREELPSLLGSGSGNRFVPVDNLHQLGRALPPSRLRVGHWAYGLEVSPTSIRSALPDFIIIREDEEEEVRAWLAAFMDALSPVSQWCRLWTLSGLDKLQSVVERPVSLPNSASWVGAILSECSNLLPSNTSMKDISGLTAIGVSSFAAGRAVSIWQRDADLSLVARRVDNLFTRFKPSQPSSLGQGILPLWLTLCEQDQRSKVSADTRALDPFKDIFRYPGELGLAVTDLPLIAQDIGGYYNIDNLAACASGPQSRRVDAVDKVARQLADSLNSTSTDAILGFAASLVDPGAAVMPELLRRYGSSIPFAPIWAGAFAGAWSPLRVMSDFGGLGRIVAKSLARSHDLFTKPQADISYEELTQWVGDGAADKLTLKTLNPRYLEVEIIAGVNLHLPWPRNAVRSDNHSEAAKSQARQRSLEFGKSSASQAGGSQDHSLSDLVQVVRSLLERVSALEATSQAEKTRSAAKATSKGQKRT